jgi:heme exporter protein D
LSTVLVVVERRVRGGAGGDRELHACLGFDEASLPGVDDAEQVEGAEVARLFAQRGLERPLGVVESTGLKARERAREDCVRFAIHQMVFAAWKRPCKVGAWLAHVVARVIAAIMRAASVRCRPALLSYVTSSLRREERSRLHGHDPARQRYRGGAANAELAT